jgi:hypothetical protein
MGTPKKKHHTKPKNYHYTTNTLREYCYRHGARIASQDNCNSMYRKERVCERGDGHTKKKHHTKPKKLPLYNKQTPLE